jgi:hypothetical protein
MGFRSRTAALAGLLLAVAGSAPAQAATVTDLISFTDVGTYQTNGGGIYNGDASVAVSFKITFDPTLLYLTQSITGVVSDLSVVVTDDRFGAGEIPLNPIINFAFDGSGTLTLSSLPGQNKNMVGTNDITIGINGWAYGPGSGAWYSQVEFGATLTTSGDVSIVAETPLPAALPLFIGGAGLLGFLVRRRKAASAAAA